MAAYYNEHDPKAAAWLRELIRAGLIAPGDVDERSIEDVLPTELAGYRQCHFFAGIGGWSYALRLVGWPDDRPVWTGSCPCTPFSLAGKREGFADERHLWPAFHHLIGVCRPPVVFGEQVAGGPAGPWIDLVQTDLEALGYACGAAAFPACSIGAPHIRQRLYWVAHAEYPERRQIVIDRQDGRNGQDNRREETHGEFGTRSEICSMADSNRAGLLKQRRAELPQNGDPSQWHDIDGCGGIGDLADPMSTGRPERRPESGSGQASGSGIAGEFGDANDERSQGRVERRNGADQRIAWPTGLDGFWRDAEWIWCRDEKWRPVVTSHVGLVDGLPDNMVRSGNQGECTYQAGEVSNGQTSYSCSDQALQPLRKGDESQAVQRGAGESAELLTSEVLRSTVHGVGDAEGTVQQRQPQSDEGESDSTRKVRGMRRDRAPSCTPSRYGPFQQQPIELEDVVRQLPSSLTLAELYGRWRDAEALRALREAICEAGSMQFSPEQTEEAWRSISSEDQDRIRMGFGQVWVARSFSPLSRGEEARVMRLRGYGNAIVPQQAAEFIRAYMGAVA